MNASILIAFALAVAIGIRTVQGAKVSWFDIYVCVIKYIVNIKLFFCTAQTSSVYHQGGDY